MTEAAPIENQIEMLRRRAAELAEKGRRAHTDAARDALRDLAKLYEEMAQAVANIETLRAKMRDDQS